jgi:hypothetical protein
LINDSIVHCESVPMIGVGDDICDEQTCDFWTSICYCRWIATNLMILNERGFDKGWNNKWIIVMKSSSINCETIILTKMKTLG